MTKAKVKVAKFGKYTEHIFLNKSIKKIIGEVKPGDELYISKVIRKKK